VRVNDSMGGSSYYEYNAFDQLTKTTDPSGHVTTVGYNNRGDRLSVNDPDLGITSFTQYTVFGEVQQQVDAKGQTVTFGYDQLGRLRTRSEPDFSNQDTVFAFYNTQDFRHGLPQSQTAPAASGFVREFIPDALRRPYQERTRIDGTDYWTESTYHTSGPALGKLNRITYPSSQPSNFRVKIDHLYDDVGLLWKVKDGDSATVFHQRNLSDALFRELNATLGSGLAEWRTYDRANLALRAIQTGPGNSIQNLSYDYYPSGTVERRTDSIAGSVETFTYDALNRLDTQTVSGFTDNFDYAADGNIIFKTGVGTYDYLSSKPHAVTGVGGVPSYAYDPNGNMMTRNGNAVTWTSFNLPKKINRAADSAEFWYGTDRSRYKQVAIINGVSTTTRYVGPHFEVETRGGLTIYRHFILAGDRAIAQYERHSDTSTPFRYLHYDHLGSVVATTGWSGPLVQRFLFDPDGTRTRTHGVAPNDTRRGFTGTSISIPFSTSFT
jgi:YD repeat-containing protein